MEAKTPYAFDIETDGLVDPIPTTFTLYNGETVACVLRTSDEDAEEDLIDLVSDEYKHYDDIEIGQIDIVSTWEEMAEMIVLNLNGLNSGDFLVTYNGLAYRGGFDIPALDYAFHQTDVSNPFQGLEHTDVYDPVDRGYVYNTAPQFPSRGGPSKSDMREAAEMFDLGDEASGLNKAPLADLLNENLDPDQMQEWAEKTDNDLPTSDVSTLDGVYEYLYEEDLPDPFDDSKQAVSAWEDGYYPEVLVHNITDCVKTIRVFEYLEESAIPFKKYAPERLG